MPFAYTNTSIQWEHVTIPEILHDGYEIAREYIPSSACDHESPENKCHFSFLFPTTYKVTILRSRRNKYFPRDGTDENYADVSLDKYLFILVSSNETHRNLSWYPWKDFSPRNLQRLNRLILHFHGLSFKAWNYIKLLRPIIQWISVTFSQRLKSAKRLSQR